MPIRPRPTCQICGNPFERPNARGRTPDYCPSCKEQRKHRPGSAYYREGRQIIKKCPRCTNAFVPDKPAQRYCSEQCRKGCRNCGKPLPEKPRPGHVRLDEYCCRTCRDEAWGVGTPTPKPLPICFFCGQEVPLPKTLRDPGKAHRWCYESHNAPKETKKAKVKT